jgi:hypothetical protein
MPCVSTDPLPSWRDDATKAAIVAFVARVTGEDGSAAVAVEDVRIAHG